MFAPIQEESDWFCVVICHYGWDTDLPLHSKNQTAVEAVGGSWWFSAKESKVDRICWKGHGQCVLRCQRDPVNLLPWKKKQLQVNIILTFLTSWMSKFVRRGMAWSRKKSSSTRTMHLLISVLAMGKLRDLRYDLLSHPPYSPDLASSDFHLFPNLKKFVSEKHLVSNEEIERAVDEYFNSLADSHFWEGIPILEKSWT